MDFTLAPEIEDIRLRVRAFVEEHVLPLESDPANFTEHENIPHERLAPVREKARKAGLWAPQAPKEYRRHGAADRGLGGHLRRGGAFDLRPAGDPLHGAGRRQHEPPGARRHARAEGQSGCKPIVEGKVRSAFAMTEPHPGSGSDPGMMLTRAEKKGDRYIIKGHKWFITGAEGAAHFILMARTSDEPRRGLTAFLYHKDQPGWRILRRIPIMGPHEHGGHCEIEYDGLEIPEENILLKVGDGLRVTQIRLGPARLTHCMRWLGFAKRCMEIAQEYVEKRDAFGSKLASREGIQIKLGEVAHQIEIGRLLTMHAAWKLDQGDRARKEVSMAKVQVADTLHQASDVAIQLNGARGYSKDTILEWIYRYAPLGAAGRRRFRGAQDGAGAIHARRGSRFLEVGLISRAPTAISSGKSSQTSCPVSVTMKVWPRKMPNSPSGVIGLGSAMITMPGFNTCSNFSAETCSATTCGLSVTRSMPWHWVGRDW